MLDPEIVQAAEAGLFHVWEVRTVDEALSLLTGVAAGRRRADGTFPPATVHGRVAERLAEFARLARGAGENT